MTDQRELEPLPKPVGFKLTGPCAWCGVAFVRAELDGEPLCETCANIWVRSEGAARNE